MTFTFEQAKEKTREYIGQQQYPQAFRAIQPFLHFPLSQAHADHWEEGLSLFLDIFCRPQDQRLTTCVKAVLDQPKNPQALFNLGFVLYECGLYGIAATALVRADEIHPEHTDIVCELASCLEAACLFKHAREVLERYPKITSESFLPRYLLAYNRLMCADIEGAKELLPSLRGTEEYVEQYMTEQLEGMLVRADIIAAQLPLNEKSLREWHMVLNGALLLHISPHGFDEGMNGRYAHVGDHYSLWQEGLHKIKALAEAGELEIPKVFAVEGKCNEAFAEVAAAFLKVPLEPWEQGSEKQEGLIAVYDLLEIDSPEVFKSFKEHKNGQVLWTHGCCWTEDLPFAPDISTFLYQHVVPPWEAFLPPEESKIEQQEYNLELALNAEVTEDQLSDIDQILLLAKLGKEATNNHLAGMFLNKGNRRRYRVGSPVPSGRFF